ncbi:hypothetical protein CS063_16915 [Sporanaerobium hydrogeniformans]|uniref:Uncharacterized protein n=1 Tax=Sporanaerobium hydrogeniformans TaxID=3072179 RepID=A0AC61D906_9FIRM|nr:putative metallopeptidase [Sporanaerobium hydrogeniformans]PHV69223.1 hypothetical protein CS063_16915 [Sporanaerobium hydrogeniformans]
MGQKRLTVVDEQTGEVKEDISFNGGYNIMYTNYHDEGRVAKILKLDNAMFSKKHWIMNEWYKPIARELIYKFKELQHIAEYKILFIEDRKWEPGAAAYNWKARIKKTNLEFEAGTGYDYILETRKYYTEKISKEQLVLMIYHELRHIGKDGEIIHHDIEDWSDIVATFGTHWHVKGQEILSILDEEFGEDDWMQVMPTRRQITLFDKVSKEG